MVLLENGSWRVWTRWWCVVFVTLVMVIEVMTLNGPNVCMVKQKYNITKRVKYRAPMTVRTYVWCFSMPPRCSTWNTEMRDLTRLETEERTAEVAVCCPGYKMKDVSCVPICPSGKTGPRCSEECPTNRWGPNCVHECGPCEHGACSPSTGECSCRDGWQGESCGISMSTTTTTPKSTTVDALLTTKPTTKVSTTPNSTPTVASTPKPTTIELNPTSVAPTTESFTSTSLKTTSISTSPKPTVTSTLVTAEHKTEPTTIAMTEIQKYVPIESMISNNITLTTLHSATHEEKTTPKIFITPSYNGTEMTAPTILTISAEGTAVTEINTKVFENVTKALTSLVFTSNNKTTVSTTSSTILTTPTVAMAPEIPKTTTTMPIRETSLLTSWAKDTTKSFPLTTTEIIKIETTKKPATTIKVLPTTAKFKPKEIWIKPAQKGEATFELKKNHDNPKHRSATNNEFPTNTTPKTIIVSIIPTSVSYATFKKIALTTASFIPQKINSTIKSQSKSTDGFTKPMYVQSVTPIPVTENLSTPSRKKSSVFSKIANNFNTSVTTSTISATKKSLEIRSTSVSNKTNTVEITTPVNTKLNSSYFITTISSTNDIPSTQKHNSTNKITKLHTTTQSTRKPGHIVSNKHYLTTKSKTITKSVTRNQTTEGTYRDAIEKFNTTKSITTTNRITTQDPADEETFHILTEPEHITAVMGDKETGRASVDLISVISIAGGVMMTVITIAVVIVMVERCKRPRYEDVRKMNDIHMQVMIENDAPPPYVRSIFHAPLPDPPTSEKCHYQPISTLDRNLKQFMRPVVVQTISPIMLENFRGILECHYDHLPRRSHDFATIQTRHSVAPSMSSTSELRHIRGRSVTESTIEALKCEAKLDVIDNTTAEPLYAEIPCWRPPLEHVIETMNINGEAVTEL